MSAYTDAVRVDNPVAWWRLDEKGGTTALDSVGKTNGAIIGGVTLGAAGFISDADLAMTFDGATGRITGAAGAGPLDIAGPLSVEGWFNLSNLPVGYVSHVFDRDNENCYFMRTEPNGGAFNVTFFVRMQDGSVEPRVQDTLNPLAVGVVCHYVGTYDGANLRLYRNGVLVATQPRTGTPATSVNTWNIGGGAGGQNFFGTLDEVAVYAAVLTPDRILAHYQAAFVAPTGAGAVPSSKGRYTYLACDLRTNQVLAELPLYTVDFTTRLDDIGDLRGKIMLSDPAANKVPNYLQNATQPGRTAVYVDRDGVLVWGGIVWTRRYRASTGELELQCMDFLSYLDHRYLTVTKNYGPAPFAIQEQLALIQDLVNWAQSVPGGNIGITVPAVASSGVNRLITFNGYERKLIGDALRELAALDLGFDLAIDVAYNPSGVPTKTLTLSYPRRGAIQGSSGWVFEHEVSGWYVNPAGVPAPDITGNVFDYMWPEDATVQAVTDYAIGSGSGSSTLQSSYSTPGLIDAGYPLLERVFDYKDAKTQQELDAHAVADGKALSNPVALPQLCVRPDLDPVLGTYTVGDDARLRILDFRFNSGVDGRNNPLGPGLDTFYRILEVNVKAGFDQPEEVTLTMGPTPL